MASPDNNIAVDILDGKYRLLSKLEIIPLSKKAGPINVRRDTSNQSRLVIELQEATRYEYRLNSAEYRIQELPGVVIRSAFSRNDIDLGTIDTGLFVGLLPIHIETVSGEAVCPLYLEVKSKKIDYDSEFRAMLSDIASWSTDLIGSIQGVSQNQLVSDPGKDWTTIQERFYILNGILNGSEFTNAIHRIVSRPHSELTEKVESIDVRRSQKWTSRTVRQLVSKNRRQPVEPDHPVWSHVGLATIPERIESGVRVETLDTLPNQFVKFVLETYEAFLSEMVLRLRKLSEGEGEPNGRQRKSILIEQIEQSRRSISQALTHSLFLGLRPLTTMVFGNPVLQRKPGYREVFKSWLSFQLATQLVWEGGEAVFEGGRKDMASLYEYWVFFCLLDALKSVADVDSSYLDTMFELNQSGLGLKLKSGVQLGPIRATADSAGRKFRVEFSYNKTFSHSDHWTKAGSWTRRMRPDYTFEIWPVEFSKPLADRNEALVRVHFDAKYKLSVANVQEDKNKPSGNKSVVKNYVRDDLLKMHAYRDAIRRTQGAYVIFPGDETTKYSEFGELLPGLGAFSLRPGLTHNGSAVVQGFLSDVIHNLSNRVSVVRRLARAQANVLGSGVLRPLSEKFTQGDFLDSIERRRLLFLSSVDDVEYQWIKRENKVVVFVQTGKPGGAQAKDVLGVQTIALKGDKNKNPHIIQLKATSNYIGLSDELSTLAYPKHISGEQLPVIIEVQQVIASEFVIPEELLKIGFEKAQEKVEVFRLADLLKL